MLGSFSVGLAGRSGKLAGGFDPSTDSLTGWWRASYAPSTMPGVASAGSSSGRDLAVSADGDDLPAAGTAQNGYDPATFTSDALESEAGDTLATFFTGAAGTLVVCALMPAASATGGVFLDKALFAERNGVFILSFSTSGAQAGIYDGAQKTITQACSTAAYHLIAMRWDNTDLKLRVDQTDATPVSAGTISTLTSRLVVAKNPGVSFHNYSLLDAATYASAVSDAKLDEWREYYNTRYALAL